MTGLYHFRNRDYSAALGRWVQMDPAGYVDGASLYVSTKSRPACSLDPLGLWTDNTDVASQGSLDAGNVPPATTSFSFLYRMPFIIGIPGTVTDVSGNVSAMIDGQWVRVKIGDTLLLGQLVRVPLKGSIVVTFLPGGAFWQYRKLGAIRVGGVPNDLGQKYGRLKYEIESAGREHDAVPKFRGTTLDERRSLPSIFPPGIVWPMILRLDSDDAAPNTPATPYGSGMPAES